MDEFVCPVCGCTDFYESREKDRGIRRRCARCQRERMKKIYATDRYKSKHRADDRLRRRNCSAEEYNAKQMAQDGRCAICGKQCGDELRADHDHVSGKFRGLLCDNCNWGLGNFKDNTELLQKAILYLNEHMND